MHQRMFSLVRTVTLSLLVVSLPAGCGGRLADPPRFVDRPPQVRVSWLGGPTLAIEFNDLTVVTDPMFGDGVDAFTMADPNEMFDLTSGPRVRTWERLSPFPGFAPESADLVLLSHAHEDHFDQAAQAQLPREVRIVLPPADRSKLEDMGFENLDALPWDETRHFDAGSGRLSVTAITARHTANPELEGLLGEGNGYWLEFSQGPWRMTMYWTGDTMPTRDVVAAVQRLGRPDLMVAHLGRVGTTGPLGQISMGIAETIELADAIAPERLLPIHHTTYPLYLEPIDGLVERSRDRGYRVDLVDVGAELVYR